MKINNKCKVVIDFVSENDAKFICKDIIIKGLAMSSKTYTLESWNSSDGNVKYMKQYRVELIVAYPNIRAVKNYINIARRHDIASFEVLAKTDENALLSIDMI